jgi:hypothetical protein
MSELHLNFSTAYWTNSNFALAVVYSEKLYDNKRKKKVNGT